MRHEFFMKKLLPLLTILLFSAFITVPVFAQTPDPTPGDDIVELANPVGSTNIQELVGKGIATALTILGSLALVAFVLGGLLWLTSGGNQERVKKGTQTMVWAAAGVFLVFASYAILNAVIAGIGAAPPGQSGGSVTTTTQ